MRDLESGLRPLWVKSGKSQSEQKFSALHQKAVTYARASSTGGGKARRCRGVFEKGEEIVFGPDGGLERDTGKDQEIVASALAHGRGGSPDWLLQPMDCLAGALRPGAAIADHMQARRPCHNQPAERRANASRRRRDD